MFALAKQGAGAAAPARRNDVILRACPQDDIVSDEGGLRPLHPCLRVQT